MEESTFRKQSLEYQAIYVWNYGKVLATRQEGNCWVVLNYVNNFFVELWYDYDLSNIKKITTFKTVDHLDNYLEEVKLGTDATMA